MHPVFNPVAPYRDLLPLYVADIANPLSLVLLLDLD